MQEKKKEQIGILERDNENLRKENKAMKEQFERQQRDMIELENSNEGLENELRAANALL